MGGADQSAEGLVDFPSDEVQVQLLDAAQGRPLKSWRFRGQREISIGRTPESDVSISDPYVSRVHAQLQFAGGRWNLVSRGRNGVVVRNEKISELPLEAEVTFQLGAGGPLLRFSVERGDSECGHTLCFDDAPLPAFSLDDAQLQDDVGQIAAGDYFQKLQAQAELLRARRNR